MPLRPDGPAGRAVQKMAASRAFAKVAPTVMPPLDRAVHRLSGGRVLIAQLMLPTILLTTTGRRSGQPRRTPLATVPFEGDLYVVGSNFGKPHHPAWTHNLLAHPEATVSHEGETFPVRAELLDDDEKARVWPAALAEWPLYDVYVRRSGRNLRVFRLVRT